MSSRTLRLIAIAAILIGAVALYLLRPEDDCEHGSEFRAEVERNR